MHARRTFLRRAFAGAIAAPFVARNASAFLPHRTRDHVLFVVIDRPADAMVGDHAPNIRGLGDAVREYDPYARVTAITIADLAKMDQAAIEEAYAPLAFIGAGSFTEWYQYGVDAEWKQKLDHWMHILQTTTVPTLAICGSHQLVAAAFNGFGAVAHMSDRGEPVRIASELAATRPRGMWPYPRVGEEGTYPIRATTIGAADPLVRAMQSAPMASAHHKDMVVDTTGFSVLYEGDPTRLPATSASDQTRVRCRVQAMKLDDPRRLLYSSQFHPEMCAFDESTGHDGGFGAAWVSTFLRMARAWWKEREVTTPSLRLSQRRDES